MKSFRYFALAFVSLALLLFVAACASSPEAQMVSPAATAAAAPAPAAPPAAPEFPAGAVQLKGELGTPVASAVDSTVADVFIEYAVEAGVVYEVFVVDGYNNGMNKGMTVEKPAKAVGYWIIKGDAKTTYPKSDYKETDNDSKSGYGFVGFTLDGVSGPVAKITADGSTMFVHVQRYKTSYVGGFMVMVSKK